MSMKEKIDTERLCVLCKNGKYQSAASEAAMHFAQRGADRESASSMARKASKYGSEQMLMLAFALWPEARGGAAEAFLGSLGSLAATYALRSDRALADAAQCLLARSCRVGAAKAEREKSSTNEKKGSAKKASKDKGQVVIVRKRIPMRFSGTAGSAG